MEFLAAIAYWTCTPLGMSDVCRLYISGHLQYQIIPKAPFSNMAIRYFSALGFDYKVF